jgi:hypothetical protein
MLDTQFFRNESPQGRRGQNKIKDQGEKGLFWWTIGITILMAAATFSWFFSIYLFSHPEIPSNYQLLSKWNKLEDLEDYNQADAPMGRYFTARELYNNYYPQSSEQLVTANRLYLRGYIKNYPNADLPPAYIKGTFRVENYRLLTNDDPITSGMVVRTKSVDYPSVVVELLLPGVDAGSPIYQTGDDIVFNADSTFASVLHVDHQPGQILTATVLPIVYGEWKLPSQGRGVTLQKPQRLNLPGHWPLTEEGVGDATEVPKAVEVATP